MPPVQFDCCGDVYVILTASQVPWAVAHRASEALDLTEPSAE
jgi:hypothetical protein